jgi:WD40 repeat protein
VNNPVSKLAFQVHNLQALHRGHSSTVTAVDWSADSRALRSTCQGYEILHFDAHSGRQAVGLYTSRIQLTHSLQEPDFNP